MVTIVISCKAHREHSSILTVERGLWSPVPCNRKRRSQGCICGAKAVAFLEDTKGFSSEIETLGAGVPHLLAPPHLRRESSESELPALGPRALSSKGEQEFNRTRAFPVSHMKPPSSSAVSAAIQLPQQLCGACPDSPFHGALG